MFSRTNVLTLVNRNAGAVVLESVQATARPPLAEELGSTDHIAADVDVVHIKCGGWAKVTHPWGRGAEVVGERVVVMGGPPCRSARPQCLRPPPRACIAVMAAEAAQGSHHRVLRGHVFCEGPLRLAAAGCGAHDDVAADVLTFAERVRAAQVPEVSYRRTWRSQVGDEGVGSLSDGSRSRFQRRGFRRWR